MKIKYIVYCIVIILVILIMHRIMYGVAGNLFIYNDSQEELVTDNDLIIDNKLLNIDLTVLVNNTIVFQDSIFSNKRLGEAINIELDVGWNEISIYSKKAKLFEVHSTFILFKKDFYVIYLNSPKGEYYSLSIEESFF